MCNKVVCEERFMLIKYFLYRRKTQKTCDKAAVDVLC